jgi:hypothetical protein
LSGALCGQYTLGSPTCLTELGEFASRPGAKCQVADIADQPWEQPFVAVGTPTQLTLELRLLLR